MDHRKIKIEELEVLLENEATFEQTLKDYFEIQQSGPFSVEFVPKVGVEIIETEIVELPSGLEGSVFKNARKTAIRLANRAARKKRNKKYNKVKNDPGRIRIVSEGDSWFQYPSFFGLSKNVKEVIDHLIEDDQYAVKSLGAGADLLRNMYHTREYFEAIHEEKPQILLISAGGNDFFEVFPKMLKKDTIIQNIEDHLDSNFETELNVLKTYYLALLKEVTKIFPDLNIIIHGYDYIIPQPDGKWIGKPMVDAGMVEDRKRQLLIKYIMDKFNDTAKEIANIPALKANVHYLNLRGTVPLNPNAWHDEIHPNNGGFALVAAKFKAKISEILSPPIAGN